MSAKESKLEKVVVFGYSDNPEKYSNKAYLLLKEYKHSAIKFNPRSQDIKEIPPTFDTLTLYLSPQVSEKFSNEILNLKFKRAIFNPGTENHILEQKLISLGVEVVHGCTLVMLKTSQF